MFYPTVNEGQGGAWPLKEITSVVDARLFAKQNLGAYKRVWLTTPPDPRGMITLAPNCIRCGRPHHERKCGR